MASHTTSILLGLALLAFLWPVEGARFIDLEGRLKAKLNLKHFLRAPLSSPEQLLGLQDGEHLRRVDQAKTAHDTIKIKYQETYLGVPINGQSVVLETDSNGKYTPAIYGSLVEGLKEHLSSIEPKLDVEQVLQIAMRNEKDNADQIIFNPHKDAHLEIILEDKSVPMTTPHLVYKLSYRVETAQKLSRPFYMIDANNGHIYRFWQGHTTYIEDMQTSHNNKQGNTINQHTSKAIIEVEGIGGNEKIGLFTYGEDRGFLQVTSTDGETCTMENDQTWVVHMDNGIFAPDPQPHEFNCLEGNLDPVNGGYSPLNDGLFHSNVVTNMFLDWFNLTPLEGTIQTRVHFGNGVDNAFWNGEAVTFGDGSNFYPMMILEIVGHEIAHGFTERLSNLIYENQSGGINEAFSDMTGEAAEHYLFGEDWLIGSRVTKGDGALRYFEDPTLDGNSIAHADDFVPGMNVHYSSGVYNRAFWLLSHTPDWDIKKAFEVFVQANRFYWTPDSTYNTAACGVEQATQDLGYNVGDVLFAFADVGVVGC